MPVSATIEFVRAVRGIRHELAVLEEKGITAEGMFLQRAAESFL